MVERLEDRCKTPPQTPQVQTGRAPEDRSDSERDVDNKEQFLDSNRFQDTRGDRLAYYVGQSKIAMAMLTRLRKSTLVDRRKKLLDLKPRKKWTARKSGPPSSHNLLSETRENFVTNQTPPNDSPEGDELEQIERDSLTEWEEVTLPTDEWSNSDNLQATEAFVDVDDATELEDKRPRILTEPIVEVPEANLHVKSFAFVDLLDGLDTGHDLDGHAGTQSVNAHDGTDLEYEFSETTSLSGLDQTLLGSYPNAANEVYEQTNEVILSEPWTQPCLDSTVLGFQRPMFVWSSLDTRSSNLRGMASLVYQSVYYLYGQQESQPTPFSSESQNWLHYKLDYGSAQNAASHSLKAKAKASLEWREALHVADDILARPTESTLVYTLLSYLNCYVKALPNLRKQRLMSLFARACDKIGPDTPLTLLLGALIPLDSPVIGEEVLHGIMQMADLMDKFPSFNFRTNYAAREMRIICLQKCGMLSEAKGYCAEAIDYSEQHIEQEGVCFWLRSKRQKARQLMIESHAYFDKGQLMLARKCLDKAEKICKFILQGWGDVESPQTIPMEYVTFEDLAKISRTKAERSSTPTECSQNMFAAEEYYQQALGYSNRAYGVGDTNSLRIKADHKDWKRNYLTRDILAAS